MYKNNPVKINADINMIASQDLLKSVASDLLVPDPTGIIAKGAKEVNEDSEKYDRGTGGIYHIQDLFSPCK